MKELIGALKDILKISEDGVVQRNETGKPTWSALDAIKQIAGEAIAKHAPANPALEALRYHVSGAIERGESVAITEQQ